MKNMCTVCRQVMDNQWVSLQDHVRKVANLENFLNKAFVERCIYCYKQCLELNERKTDEWYKEILRALK